MNIVAYCRETTCFGLKRPPSGFDNFLAISVINRVAMFRRVLYITLIARKLSKPDDGRYKPKHVVFLLLLKTPSFRHIFIVVFLTEFTSP